MAYVFSENYVAISCWNSSLCEGDEGGWRYSH